MKNILLVGLGGGIGSIARYLAQRWFTSNTAHTFPWGTFLVNVTGCFLIGILWGVSLRTIGNNDWKLLLMVGLCGGFTTFSAFTMEGISLFREQRIALFFMYTATSVIIGLLATYAGLQLVK